MKKDNKLKVTYRVNGQIRVPEVRIVGDGIESQVVPTRKALDMADAMGVDLVEISPNAEPPVCRLIEFTKFIYQQKKHAKGFLSEGDKVKAYVFFKGRSILFKEQGEVLLLRFAQDLEEYGKVESMPNLEGKRMIMYIAPKKKQPQQKARKEYTGPKVEGEDFDD